MDKKIDRFDKYMVLRGLNDNKVTNQLNLSIGTLGKSRNNGRDLSDKSVDKILNFYTEINKIWLLTGEGEMLKQPKTYAVDEIQTKIGEPQVRYGATELYKRDTTHKLIPFYDDVSSFGGLNNKTAILEGVSQPSEYIDAGDWFKEATAAIRHYGESMQEYPSGCILALKEIKNKEFIIWGRDYVIETNEYRITKRLQRGTEDDYVRAYSTNKETYPDGQLMYEPIDIHREEIHKLLMVLGYVVNKNGGTMVFNN